MSAGERFDVAIVGGGLAGLSCACETARGGLSTAVFERGAECGSKNVSGGRLYLGPLRGLLPGFWNDAPLERLVARETLTLVAGDASASFDLRAPGLAKPEHASHTVLRAKLDRWLADRAVEAGAMVLPESRVDGVVLHDGTVAGVRVGDEEIAARVVVAADGALSFVARSAELAGAPRADRLAVGAKEIVALDAGRLEDRFGLEPGRGAARLLVGDFTRGLPGGGFLYTNRDSVSMGVVVRLDAAAAAGPSGPETHALVDALRAVPEVARLLAGGETVEYSAHLVPELSFADAPPRSRPGLLVAGDAAGFVANYGFTVRGMDFAAASGILAGRAVVEAAKSGRPAEDAPGAYERALAGSFVLRDLAAARGLDRFLANDRFYGHYPRSVCALLEELFRVGAPGRGAAFRSTWKLARGTIANWRGFRDLWPARKL